LGSPGRLATSRQKKHFKGGPILLTIIGDLLFVAAAFEDFEFDLGWSTDKDSTESNTRADALMTVSG
jgi:hypothetical protein